VARNSHSLGIVAVDGANYLIIYGGASPEHGPLGDTLYAKLPAVSDIGKNVANDSRILPWLALLMRIYIISAQTRNLFSSSGRPSRVLSPALPPPHRLRLRRQRQLYSPLWPLVRQPLSSRDRSQVAERCTAPAAAME
jgi:hypothetical protein